MTPRGNKYHAKGCRVDGIWYASQAESRYAERLILLKMAGEITTFIPHPPGVVLLQSKKKTVRWKIDFLVMVGPVVEYYVEYKGLATADYKIKLELYRAKADELPPLFVVTETRNRSNAFKIIDEINPQGVKYI